MGGERVGGERAEGAGTGAGAGLFDDDGLSLDHVAAFVAPRHRKYREEVAAFCRRFLRDRPDPDADGEARLRTRELVALMGDAGLFRPIADLDVRGCLVARETLAWWSPLADAAFALQALSATPGLIADGGGVKNARGATADSTNAEATGTEAADAEATCTDSADAEAREATPAVWAARALSGQAVGAFAMTEWDAGSDVSSIATTAVRSGDGYRIDGGKAFISNAGIAKFYVVFVRTAPPDSDSGSSSRSISCFVVAADKIGVEFVREFVMSAPHPLGELRFAGCWVPKTARLGGEGDGFKIGMATLDRLRPTVAAAANGMAGRALWEAVRHARRREQFGRPLGSFQLVRQKLADSAIDLTAGRLLAYRAAWEVDRGAERITVESAMAKAFSTEAAQRIVDRAVQVLGGRGVLADHPVDRLYRAVRALRIYEGATEIQQLIVGGALAKGTP